MLSYLSERRADDFGVIFNEVVLIDEQGREDEDGNNVKAVYETVNERWEVAVAPSDKGYQQVSFVNSIATTKGGRHVDYVTDMVTKQLQEHMKVYSFD